MAARTGTFWHCAFGAAYSAGTGYPAGAGEFYFPTLRKRGRVGVELYRSQGAAIAAADRALTQLAATAGVSRQVMRERLIQEADPLRGPRRVTVAPWPAELPPLGRPRRSP